MFFLSFESRHGECTFEPPVLRCESRRSVGMWLATCSCLEGTESSSSYVSSSCVSGSRSSGSCVSHFSSFAMCASSSLAIIFVLATKFDLEVERFEDALLGLGLP
jgi:hypothetical protein